GGGEAAIGGHDDAALDLGPGHAGWNPWRSGSRESLRKRCSPLMKAEPDSSRISSPARSTSRARNARPSRFSHSIHSEVSSLRTAWRCASNAERHEPHGEGTTEWSR